MTPLHSVLPWVGDRSVHSTVSETQPQDMKSGARFAQTLARLEASGIDAWLSASQAKVRPHDGSDTGPQTDYRRGYPSEPAPLAPTEASKRPSSGRFSEYSDRGSGNRPISPHHVPLGSPDGQTAMLISPLLADDGSGHATVPGAPLRNSFAETKYVSIPVQSVQEQDLSSAQSVAPRSPLALVRPELSALPPAPPVHGSAEAVVPETNSFGAQALGRSEKVPFSSAMNVALQSIESQGARVRSARLLRMAQHCLALVVRCDQTLGSQERLALSADLRRLLSVEHPKIDQVIVNGELVWDLAKGQGS